MRTLIVDDDFTDRRMPLASATCPWVAPGQDANIGAKNQLWIGHYAFALAAAWALCVAPVFAQETTLTPGAAIKSGCEYDYPPFCVVEEGGSANGFSVELLRAALKVMNRDVTFRVGPWAEVKGLLERGEINVLPLVGRSPERESTLDFTFPYLSMHGAIVVFEGATDVQGLHDLKGRCVAVMEGDNAEEFLRRTGLGVEVHTTPTFLDALLELSDGRHDAVVIQRLLALRLIQDAEISNLRIVDKPVEQLRQDFCFAVKEGDKETLSLLNEGLALVIADGTFNRLRTRWFSALELPSDDRIVIGTELGYPPYSFLDEKGKATGYNVDLTHAIAEVTGLDVEVRIGFWAEIRQALEAGEIDAISGMFYSAERDKVVDFSPPYTIIHHKVFARRDELGVETEEVLRGKDIIVMRGDVMHDYVLENGLSDNPVLVDTQADALQLLASGKHDYALVAQLPGLHWAKELGLSNIKTVGPPLLSSEYGYAVKEGETILLQRLGEGLAALSETGAHKAIYDRWLGVLEPRGLPLSTVLRYVVLAVAPLLLMLSLLAVWSRVLKRQVSLRTKSLRTSEERYRSLFDEAPVGYHELDDEGRVVRVNQTELDMLGYGEEEMLARHIWDFVGEGDRDGARSMVLAKLEGTAEEGKLFERVYLRKDGTRVSFLIEDRVLLDDLGRPAGIRSTLQDITERKRAERALRESEEKYRGVLESIEEGYYEVDLAGNFTFFNDAACRLLAHTREELMGMNNRQYMDEENAKAVYSTFNEVFRTGNPAQSFDWQLIRKNGSTCFVESSMSLMRDLEDRPVGFRGIFRDITDRKLAEEEREKLEGQLRQSQKMEAVGQLAGGVAHDFNNLLQVILGFGDMALEEAEADSPVRTSLDEVLKAGRRAKTLVRQLLAFSRQQVLDMKDIDLNDLIANLMKMIKRVIGEHITLDIIASQDIGAVHADPGQIEQILMNLCVNARDAMPTGGTITIETQNVRIEEEYCEAHAWATPGPHVLLSVTDTGCGMDEETISRVFEPFFTTKGLSEGTGLGLSTVYGLVKQHQGMVDVYSEIGKGTTFKIYLPLVERSATTVGHKSERPVPGGTETILLAEDDVTVRKLTKIILEQAGYTMLIAVDGEEAIRLFEDHADEIDLALIDVIMPNLGGRAVYEHIRETRPGVRVLFSSGYSINAIHTNFILDEGLQLIEKPCPTNDLLRRVREVLDTGEEERVEFVRQGTGKRGPSMSETGKRPAGLLQRPFDLAVLKDRQTPADERGVTLEG